MYVHYEKNLLMKWLNPNPKYLVDYRHWNLLLDMLKIDNKEFIYFFLHPSDFLMIENNRSEITPYGNWDQSPEKP